MLLLVYRLHYSGGFKNVNKCASNKYYHHEEFCYLFTLLTCWKPKKWCDNILNTSVD